MFMSGRIHDPVNLFHSASCFAAFEPWLKLISLPTMPVASLLPAQLETAISTVRVELVYQTITTGRCQLQPQNGVLLSQSRSCQNSGWMSSTTLRGRRKITESITNILLGDYGRSV